MAYGLVWKLLEKLADRLSGPTWTWLRRKWAQNRVRSSSGAKLSILLARIDGDCRNSSLRETVRETIREQLGNAVEITTWTEPLVIGEGHEYDVERKAYETAQDWLRRTHCDLLIWGRVKGQNVLSLRFTIAEVGTQHSQVYKLTETFNLPVKFISALGAAMGARVMVSAAPAIGVAGQYLVPVMQEIERRLSPIILRIDVFDSRTRATLLFNYALVCDVLGEQLGENSYLVTAISAYQLALKEWTRESSSVDWAVVQNCMGLTLWRLGKRQNNNARLKEAVVAYNEALKEFSRP